MPLTALRRDSPAFTPSAPGPPEDDARSAREPERTPESPGGAVARRLLGFVVLVAAALGLLVLGARSAGLVASPGAAVWLVLLGFPISLLPALILLGRSLDRARPERPAGERPDPEVEHRALTVAALDGIVSADQTGRIGYANPAAERMFGWEPGALVGRPLESLMPERFRETHRRGLGRYLERREASIIGRTVELAGLTRAGEEFPLELSLSATSHAGGVLFTGILRDITTRRRDAQRRAAQYGAARALAESTREEAVPRLLEEVSQALGWALAVSYAADDEAEELRLEHVWADSAQVAEVFREEARATRITRGFGVPGSAWASGEPRWIADARSDPRFRRKRLAERLDIHGFICVPVRTEERTFGVIELCSEERERPDDELLAALAAIGVQLGHYLQRHETDRALGEAKLALEREHRFTAALLDNLDEGVMACDEDGRLVLFNRSVRELHGVGEESLRPEEWLGRFELLDGEDGAPLPGERFPLFRALRGEQVREERIVVVPADGRERRTVLACAQPILDADGERLGAAASMHDVTERTRAEEALRASEQRLRMLVDNLPDTAVLLFGRDLRYTLAAGPGLLTMGRTPEEIVGKTAFELAPGPVATKLAPAYEAALRGEETSFELRTPDGRWLSVQLLPLPGRHGGMSLTTDITDRRRAEGALRLQSEITENMAEGVCLVRRSDRQIVYANRSCEAMFGYEPGGLLGEHAAILASPDYGRRGDATATIGSRLDAAGQWSGEVRTARKDGTEFWSLLNVSTFDHPDFGEVSIVVQADITERKRWESELARARDEAIETTRLKSEFLANMSHEIRTPMNGVIGMTDLLLESPLDDEQREYAQLVRSSGESLLAILNDILDFSKIEAGKLDLEMSDFPLADAVEDVADLLAERARAKGVDMSVLVESHVPAVVHGDEVRLRQVLMNLVSNAVKFTEEGEIGVRARVPAPDSGFVRFEVKDTGIGIEPDEARRLFDSFAQADSSTSRRFGGTGLGLAIAKQLVEMMGGEIGVKSEPERGSHFWFTLPLAVVVDPGDAGAGAGTERLRGRRLLVVDDSPSDRRIVAHHARAWGMAVSEAAGGRAGLERMREAAASGTPVEIVALGTSRPETDGMALASEVRADPDLRGIRVLALCPSADRPAGVREHEVDAFVPKPVRRARLRRALLLLAGEAVEAEARAERESRGRGLTVLVAEDNAVNQKVAARMLEKRGLRAEIVGDGRQAVEAVERGGYAAVLMDCQMPGMDGYEATREIRRREGDGPRLPVIALTAHSMRGDRERCLAAGMDDYLSKPLDVGAFDAVLTRWLPEEERRGDEEEGRAAGTRDDAPMAASATPAATDAEGHERRRAAIGAGHVNGANGHPERGDGAGEAGGADPPARAPAEPDLTDRLRQPAPGDGMPRAATDPAAVARVRREIGDELYESLVQMLLEDAASSLAHMRSDLAAGDAQRLGERAHTLKGGASSLGASALTETARELQQRGREDRLAGAGELLDRLEEELVQTRTELTA